MSAPPRPQDWGVLLVTDRHACAPRPLVDAVAEALAGGVRAVQLREKDLPARELYDLAQRLRELTRRHAAALLVNDRIDVAVAAEADGVHLPSRSFDPRDARALLGPRALVGVSTHAPEEVRNAWQAGADYAVFGPVHPTPSKEKFGPPAGPGALAAACAAAPLPVLAIGGMNEATASAAIAAGACGVAVIRAVLTSPQPRDAARRLLDVTRRRT